MNKVKVYTKKPVNLEFHNKSIDWKKLDDSYTEYLSTVESKYIKKEKEYEEKRKLINSINRQKMNIYKDKHIESKEKRLNQ